MNKEELRKEAKEKYFSHKMAEFQGFYPRHYYYLGYLDSAEPREKCIEELDKEIAEQKTHLIKVKSIIKDLLSILPKENIEGVYEVVEEAEQFLREVE